MSYASQTHAGRATAIQTLTALFGDIRQRAARRRAYRKTIVELSQLSDHELSDLGLSRHTIRSDAFHAVYGTRRNG